MLHLRAVNQHAYTDYIATLFSDQVQNLTDGFAGGKDVINNKNSLTGADAKAPLESPSVSTFLFGKYAAHS
jgi:hypothetical protein